MNSQGFIYKAYCKTHSRGRIRGGHESPLFDLTPVRTTQAFVELPESLQIDKAVIDNVFEYWKEKRTKGTRDPKIPLLQRLQYSLAEREVAAWLFPCPLFFLLHPLGSLVLYS